MRFKVAALLSLGLVIFACKLSAEEDEQKQAKIGNFALRQSQQPGPLVSFGENIIDKNEVILYFFADDYIGKNKYFVDLIPGVVYGVSDKFSVFLNVPVTPGYKMGAQHSSGFEDVFLQCEYLVYGKDTKYSSEQITVVASFSFPSGSALKNPPTGFGSMGYFIGGTYNRTLVDWFYFTSYGVNLSTSNHHTKIGNVYLYELGFGRNIADVDGWIFAWLVELDGIYQIRNRIRGVLDLNSGGNVIYIVPSLWASSNDWIIQAGAGYAVQQYLFGNQKRNNYLLAFNLGRAF